MTPAVAGAQSPRRVTILHTNDWQSGLTGVGPDSAYTPDVTGDDKTQGGVARLATLVDSLRAERAASGPVFLLDGGDVTMGTLYHTVSRETGSELQLMARIGYDAVTLGNHEFDFRTLGFGQMIASAEAGLGLPPLVATNLDLSSEHPDLEVVQAMYARGALQRTRTLERGGVKVGFIGILGVLAQSVMEGGTPVQITPPIQAAKEAAAALRADGVDLVVVLSHSGVKALPDGGYGGEEVELMKQVPEIDVIVGGHSHTALHEPILVHGRPVLQAGSDTQWLGDLVLVEGPNRRWTVDKYELRAVDDQILGRADVTQHIAKVKEEVDTRILAPLGYRFDQVVAQVSAHHGRGYEQHVVGNLVTDSMRAATGAQIAFTGNGTVRADLLPGLQRVSDIFRISGLGVGTVEDTAGNPLVKAYMNGPSLKAVLEFLLVGYTIKGPSYYPRMSGLQVDYNPYRVPFDKVMAVRVGSAKEGWTEVDLSDASARISMATTAYVAKFLPQVAELSYGILEAEVLDSQDNVVATTDLRGILVDTATGTPGIQELKEWRALVDYVASRPDIDGDGIANIEESGGAAAARLIAKPSLSPGSLLANSGWPMRAALGLALLLMLAVGLILGRLVFKRRPVR